MDDFTINFWTSNSDFTKEIEICKICFEVAINSTLTQCNHLFCTSCVKQWITNEYRVNAKTTCPVCCNSLNLFIEHIDNIDIQAQEVLKLDDGMNQPKSSIQQLEF